MTNMNHADARATKEDDLLRALKLLMQKLTSDKNNADVGLEKDYKLNDLQIRNNVAEQPRGDPLRRLLRNLVTKGMSADVDETIQEEDDELEDGDPQKKQIKALKEQLGTLQVQLNKFQDKMRTAPKEGNSMSESEASGGEDYKSRANEREVKFVTGTGVTLTEGLAALYPEANLPKGDQEQKTRSNILHV